MRDVPYLDHEEDGRVEGPGQEAGEEQAGADGGELELGADRQVVVLVGVAVRGKSGDGQAR